MNKQLKILIKKIKEGKLSHEEALKQMKAFKTRNHQKFTPPSNARNQDNIVSEVYVYDEPFLRDHTVNGEQVLIGGTHGSLALNAFFKIFPEEKSVHLHRLNFVKPIEVKKDQQVEVLVEPVRKGSSIDFQVVYRYASSEVWTQTATGSLQKTNVKNEKIDVESIKKSLNQFPNLSEIYTNPIIELGESFKTITHLYVGKDQVLARVVLSQTSREEDHDYVLPPLITNSAFIAAAPLLGPSNMKNGFLPFGIKDIYFQKTTGLEDCWLLVKLVKNSGEMILFDVDVIDAESQVVVHYSGCSVKRFRSTVEPEHQRQEISVPHDAGTIEDTTKFSRKIQKYLANKLSEIVPDRSEVSNLEVNLMDLGLESSQLVALASEIAKETDIELYPTLFFEYPNIKELTKFLSEEHVDPFVKLLGMDSKQARISGAIDQTVENILPKARQEVLPSRQAVVQTPIISFTSPIRDDIAVIGMSGRFAEASNLDQFWNNLRDKKDLMKEIPIDHWDYRPWYDENPEAKNKTYCKWGSFIDDVDKFDAGFFNISPREADWMDPQLRLLLQSIYATGEDAGYINQLRGTNTGVFVGVCFHDYEDKMAELGLPVDPYMGTGNANTVVANRVSFVFDFTGPSMAVDTACSSSLFALHSACQALRNKECDMAFVGGVNLLLSSMHYRYFCSIGALSRTGRCHTFDQAADGYVP
ncbi:MAG: polyketide synthase, partial [Acidobacteria bacterium]